MSAQASRLTPNEHLQGHAACSCGEYTHIFGKRAMERLPKNYTGELCQQCGLWMCRIDKIAPKTDLDNVWTGPIPS